MRILITGSAGFIGSHLSRELEDAGHVVSGMDIKNSPEEDASDPGNLYTAFGRYNPEVVVHLADNVKRVFGDEDVMETVRDHAGMTAVVAQTCGDTDVRLVYASTGEIYGDNGYKVCDESNGPFRLPDSLFGLSKHLGEQVGFFYAPDGFTTLRFSGLYGPGLDAGLGNSALANVLWQARYGMTIPVHRGAERSWCWIGDAVRAVRLVIERGAGAYNICRDDDPVSMWAVAEIACVQTGAFQSLVKTVDPPPHQTVVRRLSAEKIRQLSWEPTMSLYDGIKVMLESWANYLDEDGKYVNLRSVS